MAAPAAVAVHTNAITPTSLENFKINLSLNVEQSHTNWGKERLFSILTLATFADLSLNSVLEYSSYTRQCRCQTLDSHQSFGCKQSRGLVLAVVKVAVN